MSFTRVHNGVAFAAYEKLTSTDVNALRTNDDTLWASHNRGLLTAEIAGAAGMLGPFFWSTHYGTYIALALPNGSTPSSGVYTFAPPGGRIATKILAAVPTGVTTGDACPTLITAVDQLNGGMVAAMLYTDAATGTGVADSADMATWTREYYGGSALGATLTRVSSLTLASGKVVTPVVDVATHGTFILTTAYDSHVSCSIVAGSAATGAPTSAAINAAKTLAMLCASSSLHVFVYSDTLTSGTTYATPVHANASATASDRRIAYDPILGRFVMMTPGAYASSTSSGYLYWTTNDGASAWSSTAGWKRAYLGYQNTSSAPFSLLDFTITQDGAWLVVIQDKRPISTGLNVLRVLISFDQGATWNDYGSWPRTTSFGALLSSGGPGFALIEQLAGSPCFVSVSGAAPTSTAINSEAL